jgi:hypothetical protein
LKRGGRGVNTKIYEDKRRDMRKIPDPTGLRMEYQGYRSGYVLGVEIVPACTSGWANQLILEPKSSQFAREQTNKQQSKIEARYLSTPKGVRLR